MDYPNNYLTRDNSENHVSSLASSQNWDSLVEYLKQHEHQIDFTRRPLENEPAPSMMTPLHFAAGGNAPKDIIQKLLDLGATRSLKTAEGETAYDIGKRKGLPDDVLDLLKIPKKVKQNQKSIEEMEKSLHSLMKSHVGILACVNISRQQLPQLSYLIEHGDSFFLWVPGMHGGITVTEHEKGIIVAWYSNMVSGSEECHLVERDGTIIRDVERVEDHW